MSKNEMRRFIHYWLIRSIRHQPSTHNITGQPDSGSAVPISNPGPKVNGYAIRKRRISRVELAKCNCVTELSEVRNDIPIGVPEVVGHRALACKSVSFFRE